MRETMQALLLGTAIAAAGANDVEEQTLWGVFVEAFADEVAGQPGVEELAKTARFEQAGIAFEHPAALRVRSSTEGYPSWSLSRGDFELELHAPDSPMRAYEYIDLLAEIAGGDDAADAAEVVRTVEWCGRTIEAREVRFEMFGEVHVFTGYDLPAPTGEARFLVFDDVLVDGVPSNAATATFAAVERSLRCT